MAYQPRTGQTDANRNLASNIHATGLTYNQATDRVALMVKAMLAKQKSGTGLQLESDRLTHGD
jgi:ethanolamine ammonia-lyase small subunit